MSKIDEWIRQGEGCPKLMIRWCAMSAICWKKMQIFRKLKRGYFMYVGSASHKIVMDLLCEIVCVSTVFVIIFDNETKTIFKMVKIRVHWGFYSKSVGNCQYVSASFVGDFSDDVWSARGQVSARINIWERLFISATSSSGQILLCSERMNSSSSCKTGACDKGLIIRSTV